MPDLVVETVPGITAMQDLAARSGTVLAEGTERLALVPYTAGDDALRSALRSFDTVVVYKGGRHLPAVLRAVGERRAVYGEELGRPGQTLTAPDGAAPVLLDRDPPRAAPGTGEPAVSGAAHNEEVEATVETPLHRAPAECKVLATILFVVAVALVPRGHLVWPYRARRRAARAPSRSPPARRSRCWPGGS